LDTVEINPTYPANAAVIWLHGLGADGHDFAPLVPQLTLESEQHVRFVFPHAPLRPITLNNGYVMRGWYDIASLDFGAAPDISGIRASTAAIHELITREVQRGIAAARIVLAGFSQGGCIALQAGLSYPHALAGIMGLSTYLAATADPHWQRHSANDRTPILMAHGTQDSVVQYRYGEMSARQLQQWGCPVEWRSYPMPHSVCGQEIEDISAWLRRILG
jgi:phospholipase/carboxylesterase